MKLYHGTKKKNLRSILKHGLLRGRKTGGYWGDKGDTVYIYMSKDIEIAKTYGDVILEIDCDGLDLRVWDKDKDDGQIMSAQDIIKDKIKLL